MLLDARLRRQHQEQRSLAIQVLNAYAEAMNATTTEGDTPPQRERGRVENLPPQQLFGDMGAKVKVATRGE